MRLRLLFAGVVLPLLLWASLPLTSSGQTPKGNSATLQSKINSKRAELNAKLGKERVLSSDVAGFSERIHKLQSRISKLQKRQGDLQADLDDKRSELEAIQVDLRSERRRLAHLRQKLAKGRELLSQRMVKMYQAQPPDLVTVVLDSDGFADLLERGEFLKRVHDQDQRIITLVTTRKAEATETAARLDKLELRQQRVTARVLTRRNEVASVKGDLVSSQDNFRQARRAKQRILGKVRDDRHEVQEDLASLERANAKVTGQLQGALPTQPVKGGNGPWIWPVTGPITGNFGEQRPGHIHAGIDIAVPVGTPIRAVANGRVVLMGPTGGYGNYTCVQHTGSLASCYAHQRNFATSVGATVSKGQVIGYVGMTGHTFGPHLHFEARVSGTPVSPFNYL
jgi:murein DD-endopeptidase MepM/ murein hydrolase activator NlpD